MKEYKNAVCKGSYKLGTACGECEKCSLEFKELMKEIKMSDLWVFDENGSCNECELMVHSERASCGDIALFFSGIDCRKIGKGCFKKPEKWEPCTPENVKVGDTVKFDYSDSDVEGPLVTYKVRDIHNDGFCIMAEYEMITTYVTKKIKNYKRLIE